jgi:hypothetical protein
MPTAPPPGYPRLEPGHVAITHHSHFYRYPTIHLRYPIIALLWEPLIELSIVVTDVRQVVKEVRSPQNTPLIFQRWSPELLPPHVRSCTPQTCKDLALYSTFYPGASTSLTPNHPAETQTQLVMNLPLVDVHILSSSFHLAALVEPLATTNNYPTIAATNLLILQPLKLLDS